MSVPPPPIASPPPPGTCTQAELAQTREALAAAFGRWDQTARLKQSRTVRFALLLALLGPLAVLLLTVQVLVFPEPGPIAVGLIGLELGALFVVLVAGFAEVGPSPSEWIRARLRAEVLRREQYLVEARVGPYLTTSDPCEAIRQRLLVIDNEVAEPLPLVSLQHEYGRPWRDALEDAGPGASRAPEPGFLERFLQTRVCDQRDWYDRNAGRHRRLHVRFEVVARVALVLALVISGMHLLLLLGGAHGPDGGRAPLQVVVEVTAIVLPPVGAAATALQSLFRGRHLYGLYRHQARALHELAGAFQDLKTSRAAGSISAPAGDHQLKRLVLRTEELLANEQRQWWLLMRS